MAYLGMCTDNYLMCIYFPSFPIITIVTDPQNHMQYEFGRHAVYEFRSFVWPQPTSEHLSWCKEVGRFGSDQSHQSFKRNKLSSQSSLKIWQRFRMEQFEMCKNAEVHEKQSRVQQIRSSHRTFHKAEWMFWGPKDHFFPFCSQSSPFQPPLISVPTVWHPLKFLQVPFKHWCKSPWGLLQAEQAQPSQPFFSEELFHPLEHFCAPSSPSLCWYRGLPWTSCGILDLILLKTPRATSGACPGPFGCHPVLQECQLHHSAWRHPWIFWACTWSHYRPPRDTTCHQCPIWTLSLSPLWLWPSLLIHWALQPWNPSLSNQREGYWPSECFSNGLPVFSSISRVQCKIGRYTQ